MHVGVGDRARPVDRAGRIVVREGPRACVENRLHPLPPFRRRLVEVPFGLHHPLWIEDPDFDLDYHVRRAALPGARRRRRSWPSSPPTSSAGRLDRARPLWEMYVVEGLEHGHIGRRHQDAPRRHRRRVRRRAHREPARPRRPSRSAPAARSAVAARSGARRHRVMVGYALVVRRRPTRCGRPRPLGARVELALNLRRRNRLARRRPRRRRRSSAPKTSLNTTITPHRRFALDRGRPRRREAVKNALGGTVNDVVLAVCAGRAARRSWPSTARRPTRTSSPWSRSRCGAEDQKGTMGNRVSAMFVQLVTTIDDPGRAAARHPRGDEGRQGAGEGDLRRARCRTGPSSPRRRVAARAARAGVEPAGAATGSAPLFNLVISNVPGPNFPLYSAGARMVGDVADGPGHRRRRAQHHGHELPGHGQLRARRLPGGRSRPRLGWRATSERRWRNC